MNKKEGSGLIKSIIQSQAKDEKYKSSTSSNQKVSDSQVILRASMTYMRSLIAAVDRV